MTHGQGKYTYLKQNHLERMLNTLCNSWKSAMRMNYYKDLLFIDCTAGQGFTEDYAKTSPVTINEFANKNFPGRFQHLCIEQNLEHFGSLYANMWDKPGVILRKGSYQNVLPKWIDHLNLRGIGKNAIGLVYCDPDGVRELLQGIEFFKEMNSRTETSHMDYAFNVNIGAYKRNHMALRNHKSGGLYRRPVFDVLDEIADMKCNVAVSVPQGSDGSQWSIFYCVNHDSPYRKMINEGGFESYKNWKTLMKDRMGEPLADD